MTFLKKLFSGSSVQHEKRYYTFQVKCNRCGEIIDGRVDLDNDLSVEYEQEGEVYHARKVLMGGRKCFQRLETTFKFNSVRKLIEKQINGGEFV